jgi:hypothetical protein
MKNGKILPFYILPFYHLTCGPTWNIFNNLYYFILPLNNSKSTNLKTNLHKKNYSILKEPKITLRLYNYCITNSSMFNDTPLMIA